MDGIENGSRSHIPQAAGHDLFSATKGAWPSEGACFEKVCGGPCRPPLLEIDIFPGVRGCRCSLESEDGGKAGYALK